MPVGASAMLDFDTGQTTAALAAIALVSQLPGASLTAVQVEALTGGRMAVAFGGGRVWLAAQTRSAPPRPSGGAVAAARGGTVVVAPSAQALQAALAGAAAKAPTARAAFDRRFTGLPASSTRVAFGPRALLAAGSPALARTAWGRSLRAGAAVLVARDDRLVLAFDISADPSGLSRASLPIVGGGRPRAAGRGPVVAAVRSPAQTLSFLRSAGLLPALDVLSRAPGFLRPDLSELGPQATIVAADERTLTVRFTPPDPGDWSTKLARLDALSGLIRFAGLADVRIDRAADGAYTIESDGALVGRVGVYERVVVFSTDPRADLRAAAMRLRLSGARSGRRPDPAGRSLAVRRRSARACPRRRRRGHGLGSRRTVLAPGRARRPRALTRAVRRGLSAPQLQPASARPTPTSGARLTARLWPSRTASRGSAAGG